MPNKIQLLMKDKVIFKVKIQITDLALNPKNQNPFF